MRAISTSTIELFGKAKTYIIDFSVVFDNNHFIFIFKHLISCIDELRVVLSRVFPREYSDFFF